MAKSLWCRLDWHKWARRNVEGGGQYLVCVRCGKEDHGTLSTPGRWAGASEAGPCAPDVGRGWPSTKIWDGVHPVAAGVQDVLGSGLQSVP